MKKLVELKKEESGVIASVNGDTRFVSRITSIGITPGCKITIVKMKSIVHCLFIPATQ